MEAKAPDVMECVIDTHLVSFGARRPLLSWVTLRRQDRELRKDMQGCWIKLISVLMHKTKKGRKRRTYRRAVGSGHSWQTWFSCGTLEENMWSLMRVQKGQAGNCHATQEDE